MEAPEGSRTLWNPNNTNKVTSAVDLVGIVTVSLSNLTFSSTGLWNGFRFWFNYPLPGLTSRSHMCFKNNKLFMTSYLDNLKFAYSSKNVTSVVILPQGLRRNHVVVEGDYWGRFTTSSAEIKDEQWPQGGTYAPTLVTSRQPEGAVNNSAGGTDVVRTDAAPFLSPCVRPDQSEGCWCHQKSPGPRFPEPCRWLKMLWDGPHVSNWGLSGTGG